jgi:hypothetical protein
MTKITIEVDGPAVVQTQPSTPTAPTETYPGQAAPASSLAPGDVDGGSAPSVDLSHPGPHPFTSDVSQPSFDRSQAISAGSAPEHLMNLTEDRGAQ